MFLCLTLWICVMGKCKVLVTGAAGLIGSHVADACLKLEMDVVATDDLSGGFRDNVPSEAVWRGEICEVQIL